MDSNDTNNQEFNSKDINPSSKQTSNLETNNLVSDYHSDKDIEYTFGWSRYSEITNGRFAMLGFLAILIIELISNKSFLSWAGIIN